MDTNKETQDFQIPNSWNWELEICELYNITPLLEGVLWARAQETYKRMGQPIERLFIWPAAGEIFLGVFSVVRLVKVVVLMARRRRKFFGGFQWFFRRPAAGEKKSGRPYVPVAPPRGCF